MNIAITLVHNKSDAENEAQINAVKALLTEETELLDGVDEEGGIIPNAFSRTYYRFTDILFPHEVEIQHIIPYQPDNLSNPYNAKLPSSINSLRGRNVQYGKNDTDKVGDHPRFFNWSLKRGTDYGAEINIYVENYKKLNIQDLAFQLNTLIDPTDKREYIEDTSVKLATLKLLKDVGQLDETKTKNQAIAEYKTKVISKGLEIEEVKNG